MLNKLLELVDSKIDKAQYAVQNGVPYTDSLLDLQEIRTAIMTLKDENYNESLHTNGTGGEGKPSDG